MRTPIEDAGGSHWFARRMLPAALLLLAAWAQSVAADASSRREQWNAENTVVRVGTLVDALTGDRMQVRLDESGFAVIELPTVALNLRELTELAVPLAGETPPAQVMVFWWRTIGAKLQAHPLVADSDDVFRGSMGTVQYWPDSIPAIALRLEGRPGDEFVIGPVELYSPDYTSPAREMFRAAYTPEPWTLASINTFRLDRAKTSRLYLTQWIGLLVLGAGVVALLLAVRAPRRFTRTIPLLMSLSLTAWLLLDSVWLRQLFWRTQGTLQSFAGVNDTQRLARSIDAAEVAIATQLREQLPADARIFVATRADKVGNRLAYYLYPLNVYWQRGGPELPSPSALRPGDFLAVLAPSSLQLSADARRLRTPGDEIIPVNLVQSGRWGMLLEVRS